MMNKIDELRQALCGIQKKRRKPYMLLALPNAALLLVNIIILFKPEMMDRLVVAEKREKPIVAPAPLPAPAPPQPLVIAGRFTRGTSLDVLLKQNGFTPSQIHELFSVSKSAYDLSKVKAGNRFALELAPATGELKRFQYDIDDERYLTIQRGEKGWEPALRYFPMEKRVEAVSGVIADSLFNAIVDSGEKEILALDIANIFQWDIDFDTDLRVGDGFRLLVEKHFREGRLVKYGPILAAEICNQGKNYKGIRFQPPGGRLEYFNTDGRPLRRELRKSPLQFMAPVSSRFSSSRFHPILKIYRPHFGIDYMAPEGMPVVAIADGRVALMGWDSGGGNMIRLEHKGAMSSMYMHLSRFAAGMAQGASIKQGEVIGYVGQTGLSTGPHLDFRILKGNRYLNPTRVQGTPVDPLPAAQMPMFAQTRDNIWARLSAVPLPVNAPQTARK